MPLTAIGLRWRRYGVMALPVAGRTMPLRIDRITVAMPAAAWFVVKGSVQILKGRGDRFRQCIVNAGIEAGTRRQVITSCHFVKP